MDVVYLSNTETDQENEFNINIWPLAKLGPVGIYQEEVSATFVVGSDTDVMTVYVLDSRW
jgi:hypothetical protein